ncbi:MAG TPA: DUF4249 family protein [Bacteroidales bacterium]|nr:DUF4249 family protein [Bacteroidales bacterium]
MKNSWLIILTLVFVSCESVIDLPIEEPGSQYVVNSILNPDSVVRVYISKSVSLTDSAYFPDVNDATVILYENNTTIDTLKHHPGGEYRSLYKPKPLMQYSAKVFTSDNVTLQALDSVPSLPEINSPALVRNDSGIILLNMLLEDSPVSGNIYLFRVFEKRKNGKLYKVEFSIKNFERMLSMIDTSIVFTDSEFNGTRKKMEIYFSAPYAQQIIVRVSIISKAYYLYLLTWTQNHLANQISEYERVPNYCNIQHGLGIWCAESQKEFTISLMK